MTEEDAATLAGILLQADGNCSHCYTYLFKLAKRRWPEIDWLAMAKRHPESLTVSDEDFLETVDEAKP